MSPVQPACTALLWKGINPYEYRCLKSGCLFLGAESESELIQKVQNTVCRNSYRTES